VKHGTTQVVRAAVETVRKTIRDSGKTPNVAPGESVCGEARNNRATVMIALTSPTYNDSREYALSIAGVLSQLIGQYAELGNKRGS
jgi:uncharacterized protein (DUF934 family)